MQSYTSLRLDDVVLINVKDINSLKKQRNAIGIIRYIGSIYGYALTEFVGVELLDAIKGAHNGTINGFQYYQTEPQHGWHVRMTNIVKKLHAADVVKKMKQVIDMFTNKLEEYENALHQRNTYIKKLKKEMRKLQQRIMNSLQRTSFSKQTQISNNESINIFEHCANLNKLSLCSSQVITPLTPSSRMINDRGQQFIVYTPNVQTINEQNPINVENQPQKQMFNVDRRKMSLICLSPVNNSLPHLIINNMRNSVKSEIKQKYAQESYAESTETGISEYSDDYQTTVDQITPESIFTPLQISRERPSFSYSYKSDNNTIVSDWDISRTISQHQSFTPNEINVGHSAFQNNRSSMHIRGRISDVHRKQRKIKNIKKKNISNLSFVNIKPAIYSNNSDTFVEYGTSITNDTEILSPSLESYVEYEVYSEIPKYEKQSNMHPQQAEQIPSFYQYHRQHGSINHQNAVQSMPISYIPNYSIVQGNELQYMSNFKQNHTILPKSHRKSKNVKPILMLNNNSSYNNHYPYLDIMRIQQQQIHSQRQQNYNVSVQNIQQNGVLQTQQIYQHPQQHIYHTTEIPPTRLIFNGNKK